jgi:diphosphomevalonate decarboxylase
LTKATALLAETHHPKRKIELAEQSRLSRQGSGSSCRSFLPPGPFGARTGAKGAHIDVNLDHAVIIVEDRAKDVSSSDAHVRVTTSRLFEGRKRRAEERLEQFTSALHSGDWKQAYQIAWAEFWDMHALFETSVPHFGYMQPGTIEALNHLRGIWTKTGDGPIVTMDAGANVHVLLRQDQRTDAKEWLKPFRTIASWGLNA